MGILTYAKIAAAVVILAVCGFFVWNYHHMQTKIVKLEEKVAGLELRAEVIETAQKATDAFMKKKAAVQKRATGAKAKIDTVVEAKDDAGMKQLFINNGLLMPEPKPAPPR